MLATRGRSTMDSQQLTVAWDALPGALCLLREVRLTQNL